MKRLIVVVAIAMVGLVAAGCGSDDSSSGTSTGSSGSSEKGSAKSIPAGPIKVGMPIALTGPISLFDADMKTGAQLAVAQINAKGGVDGHRFEIVTADTESDVAKGSTAALDVIGNGASMIIPTLDYNFGGAAARVANSKKMIAISSAGDPRYGTKGIGPYMFNLYGGSPTEGATMAEFAYTNRKWRKVYVLADQLITHETETCKAFKDSFEQLGGTVVDEDKFEGSAASIATQATRMRAAQNGVDGIVLCSFPPGSTAALKQLRGAGITKDILLDQAVDGNGWEKGLSDTSGLYGVSVGILTPGQEKDPKIAKTFDEAAKLSGKPNSFSLGILTGYSAVEAYADAVKAVGSLDADAVKSYLETYKDKPLVMGKTTWTPACHLAMGRALKMVDFEGGKEQYVADVKPTKLPDPAC